MLNMRSLPPYVETQTLLVLSLERVASVTSADPDMQLLLKVAEQGFPDERKKADNVVASFLAHRSSLYVADGVVMFQDRAVIPPALRYEVLHTHHSAYLGVTAMESRARFIVFWPWITASIHAKRDGRSACNKEAPSQVATD